MVLSHAAVLDCGGVLRKTERDRNVVLPSEKLVESWSVVAAHVRAAAEVLPPLPITAESMLTSYSVRCK